MSNDDFSNAISFFLSRYLSHVGEGGSDDDSSDRSVGDSDWSTVEDWSTAGSEEDSDKQSGENEDKQNGESSDKSESSQRTEKSNDLTSGLPVITARPKWLNSVKSYVEETNADSLDLSYRQMSADEVVSVFKSLVNSQVTELVFYNSNLKNSVKNFAQLLSQTKLKKLSFSNCKLTSDDLSQLMKVLKDSEVTDLDLSLTGTHFDKNLTSKFATYLRQSKLTHLNIRMNSVSGLAGVPFGQSLPNTSITCLNLQGLVSDLKSRKFITAVLSSLPKSAVTDLNLCGDRLSSEQVKLLSEVLKDSKVEKLNLHGNSLRDTGVDVLITGLVHSKITELVLSNNSIKGRNQLGQNLKHTQIKTLDLSSNEIKYEDMFGFPDFSKGSPLSVLILTESYVEDTIGWKLMKSLKSTEITELLISYNDLGSDSISEFCENVKFTNITEVHLGSNDLSYEGIYALGNCLKESKLKTVILFETFRSLDSPSVARFLEKTKGSSVTSLDLAQINFKIDTAVSKSLENTTFTHFDLNECGFNPKDISNLAAALKFTAITHLELQHNNIGDQSVKVLAEGLKGSHVVSLDISRNAITSDGAKILADALKDTNLLDLTIHGNKITDDGLNYLAKQISSTFVTVLDAGIDYGSRESLIALDTALWKNRKIVQQLIDTFKQIIPEANDTDFRFGSNVDGTDFSALLEDCLALYNTVVKRPSATYVLAEQECFSLSKSQITNIMLNEFPRQFAMFIGRSVKAEVAQHVDFLKRTEELGLSSLTEFLLLNRCLFVIDSDQNILHPLVYKLMNKYKQPIVNSSVEPGSEEKLINYFTNHEELEGATDIVNLLRENANGTRKDQNSECAK